MNLCSVLKGYSESAGRWIRCTIYGSILMYYFSGLQCRCVVFNDAVGLYGGACIKNVMYSLVRSVIRPKIRGCDTCLLRVSSIVVSSGMI